MSAATENGIVSKEDVPAVKLTGITAYWDKVRYLLVHLLSYVHYVHSEAHKNRAFKEFLV